MRLPSSLSSVTRLWTGLSVSKVYRLKVIFEGVSGRVAAVGSAGDAMLESQQLGASAVTSARLCLYKWVWRADAVTSASPYLYKRVGTIHIQEGLES